MVILIRVGEIRVSERPQPFRDANPGLVLRSSPRALRQAQAVTGWASLPSNESYQLVPHFGRDALTRTMV